METTNNVKIKMKDTILNKLLIIIIGNFFCSIAINIYAIPNGLLSGGVGGLGILAQYLTSVPSGIIVFLINFPIFIIGAKMVNRQFAIHGFISMFTFSILLTLTYGITKYLPVNDILLGAVFGGVFNGIGLGILFRNEVCQDGVDVIATVLLRKYNIKMATTLLVVNTSIVTISSFLFGARSAMYTIIAIYITSIIINKIKIGFNVKQNIIIMSDKSEIMASEISSQLKRGLTFLDGTGYYKKENKKIIYLIITSNQVVKLREIVNRIDPDAFLIINSVVDVKGGAFESFDI